VEAGDGDALRRGAIVAQVGQRLTVSFHLRGPPYTPTQVELRAATSTIEREPKVVPERPSTDAGGHAAPCTNP